MAAYLIAFAKVRNANRIPEYSSAAGPTLAASGGSVVTRGKVRSLVGGFSADSAARRGDGFEFPGTGRAYLKGTKYLGAAFTQPRPSATPDGAVLRLRA
jgi:Domain of unknown function (DUF1330)